MECWFALELRVLVLFALMAIAFAISGLLAQQGLGWYGYAWTHAALITLGFLIR